jgi:hypothetical protein
MTPRLEFWHDLWCGDMSLKETFLDLFGIACAKNASVAAHVKLSGGSI